MNWGLFYPQLRMEKEKAVVMFGRYLTLVCIYTLIASSLAKADDGEWIVEQRTKCLSLPHHAFENTIFDSGKIFAFRCQLEGESDGSFASWYSNGLLKSKGSFVENRGEGYWIYYYPSGEKKAEGTCKAGKTGPDWKTYAQDKEFTPKISAKEMEIDYCHLGKFYPWNDSPSSYSFEDDGHGTSLKNHWLNFRFEPVYVQQSSRGASYSAGIHYSPEIPLSQLLSFSPVLGIFPLADAGVGDKFLVSEAALLLSAAIYGPLRGEFGIGEQYWSGRVDSATAFIFDLGWDKPLRNLKHLKMLYMGVTRFNNSSNSALELRMGMEWTF